MYHTSEGPFSVNPWPSCMGDAAVQDFVGSNNLNLLFPSGQFGTRAMGGKDSASVGRASSASAFSLDPIPLGGRSSRSQLCSPRLLLELIFAHCDLQ